MTVRALRTESRAHPGYRCACHQFGHALARRNATDQNVLLQKRTAQACAGNVFPERPALLSHMKHNFQLGMQHSSSRAAGAATGTFKAFWCGGLGFEPTAEAGESFEHAATEVLVTTPRVSFPSLICVPWICHHAQDHTRRGVLRSEKC